MAVIRGHVQEIVLKHDASRIVQSVVKYGGQSERDEVAKELKGKYRELAQNKYSKVCMASLIDLYLRGSHCNQQFLVTKLIRLCPAHRAAILQEFHGYTPRLLLHRDASGVLADAFELYANAHERALLLRDFYGKEAQLFSVTAGSDADKERAKKGLRGVLDGADADRRKRVMNAVKENLDTVYVMSSLVDGVGLTYL
jgi:pumilio family protein 6